MGGMTRLAITELTWSPPDTAPEDLTAVVQVPPRLQSLWLDGYLWFTRHPGAVGWAVTILRDGRPVGLVTCDWAPGQEMGHHRLAERVAVDPGTTASVAVTLSGGYWYHRPGFPQHLSVMDAPPPSPGDEAAARLLFGGDDG